MGYKFLRPCLGPAVYEIVNTEDLKSKVAAGGEFNIRLDLEIRQQLKKKGKELRVGGRDFTFQDERRFHLCASRCRKAKGLTT